MVNIREARRDDCAAMREIEWAAGEQFRTIPGLAFVADDPPLSVEEYGDYADDGRAWVAVDDGGDAVGYVIVDVLDGNAHVEQVSVVPAHQGEGVGKALLDEVRAYAVARGMPAVTLTTFDHVPWNRPLYEHLGFRAMTEDEIGPELRDRRATEAEEGLDPALRSCMRLDV